MAAIIIKQDAKAKWLSGMTGVRAKAYDMVQRAMAYAAATIIIGAVGAALLQLAAQILSFPAPIAVTAMTLMAAALLNWLRPARRAARPAASWWQGPARPRGCACRGRRR